MRQFLVIILASLLQTDVNGQSACEDVDANACVAMATQNPNMCSETVLATSVCPKHCDRCPLLCYSGHMTIDADGHHSNTITCTSGEVCMLSPTHHGSSLYQAACGDEQKCNHDSMCCSEDLCNTPHNLVTRPPPTTTNAPPATSPTTARPTTKRVCKKDIIFVVDGSRPMQPEFGYVKDLVKQLIDLVPIQVGLSTLSIFAYSAGLDSAIRSHTYSNVAQLKSMVNGLFVASPYRAINYVGLDILSTEATRLHSSSRAAVFISATTSPYIPFQEQLLLGRLRASYHNVVSIGIGNSDQSLMSKVASDQAHLLNLSSLRELTTSNVVNKIYNLICN